MEQESIYHFTEEKSNSKYVLYPQNAYSSFFYIVASLYIVSNIQKFYFISYTLSVVLLVLGIVSFLWWAKRDLYTQKIDIVLYSSLLYFFGFFSLAILYPLYETVLSLIYILMTFVFFFTINTKNKNTIKNINITSMTVSFFLLFLVSDKVINLNMLIGGVGSSITGFIFKLGDTYDFCPKFIVGTAWFHILSALGISLVIVSFQ